MLKWRIRENSHGGFVAEYGAEIRSGISAGFKPGCFMSGFVVHESANFDTKKQAENYIKRRCTK